jgi:hypothetical protein
MPKVHKALAAEDSFVDTIPTATQSRQGETREGWRVV